MTDAWDERTEAIPGTKGDKSFELDFDFVDGAAETAALARPSVVVFEPTAIGLAEALVDMGFNVRMGTTGVDVMSVVAQDPPGAVLCAPAPDAERRRLLAAALRLRFPNIPIVYVSTHAGQEDAVLGALREGARAVLAWPLPSASDIMRVLGPYLNTSNTPGSGASGAGSGAGRGADAAIARLARSSDTGPAERAPAAPARVGSSRTPAPPPRTIVGADDDDDGSSAPTNKLALPRPVRPPASVEDDAFEEVATLVTPSIASQAPVASPVPETGPLPPSPKARPQGQTKEVPSRIPGFADEPTTQPNMRPAAAAVQEALSEKRGEIGDLLAAVSPFLWSLEDASRWAAELGAKGDPVAQSHARSLTLLAKILAQLQARIDETGI